jgi:uncharacterized protein (DUF433 family)
MSYVENKNGGLYLTGTRVSLDSVIHQFQHGAAPESILRSFPLIGSLERVYGAIAYYLANQSSVEEHLSRQADLWAREQKSHPLPDSLQDRLAANPRFPR